MLTVRGESMIEAGILDGDFILVRKQSDAQNGDIVVALIEDEATVKTFYKEKDHIRLQLQARSPFYEQAQYILDVNVLDNYDKINLIVSQIRQTLNL